MSDRKPLYEKFYSQAEIEAYVREHRPEPPPIDPRRAKFRAEKRAEALRVARIVTDHTRRDAA